MKILIIGAAGFVGCNLATRLLELGYEVTGIDIVESRLPSGYSGYRHIKADTRISGTWQKEVESSSVIINLAGRSIFGLWTAAYRKDIYESRILTTRNIADAAPGGGVLINASAVGFFGDRGDDLLTETDPPGNDFLAEVCRDWEDAAWRAGDKGTRIAILRFGIIIGKKEGALKNMVPAYRLGLGGPLGSGRQWFPWIHKEDIIGAVLFAMKNEVSGVFNTCSPGLITQSDFSGSLARAVKMPAFIAVPKPVLELFLGGLGEALTSSQRANPQKLIDLGFEFKYKDIDNALNDSL